MANGPFQLSMEHMDGSSNPSTLILAHIIYFQDFSVDPHKNRVHKKNRKINNSSKFNNHAKVFTKRLGTILFLVSMAIACGSQPAHAASSAKNKELPTTTTTTRGILESNSSRGTSQFISRTKKSPRAASIHSRTTSARISTRRTQSIKSNPSGVNEVIGLSAELALPRDTPQPRTEPSILNDDETNIDDLSDQSSNLSQSELDSDLSLSAEGFTKHILNKSLKSSSSSKKLIPRAGKSDELTEENLAALEKQEAFKAKLPPKANVDRKVKSEADLRLSSKGSTSNKSQARKKISSKMIILAPRYQAIEILLQEKISGIGKSLKHESLGLVSPATQINRKLYLPSNVLSQRINSKDIKSFILQPIDLEYKNILLAIHSGKIPVTIVYKDDLNGISRFYAYHTGFPDKYDSQESMRALNKTVQEVLQTAGQSLNLICPTNHSSHILHYGWLPSMYKNPFPPSSRPGLTRLLPDNINLSQGNRIKFPSGTTLKEIKSVPEFCRKLIEGQYTTEVQDKLEKNFGFSKEHIQVKIENDTQAAEWEGQKIEQAMGNQLSNSHKGFIFATTASASRAANSILGQLEQRARLGFYLDEAKVSAIKPDSDFAKIDWSRKNKWDKPEVLLQIANVDLKNENNSLENTSKNMASYKKAESKAFKNIEKLDTAVSTSLKFMVFEEAIEETKSPNSHILDGNTPLSKQTNASIKCLSTNINLVNSPVVEFRPSMENFDMLEKLEGEVKDGSNSFKLSLDKVFTTCEKALQKNNELYLENICKGFKLKMNNQTHEQLQENFEEFAKNKENIEPFT